MQDILLVPLAIFYIAVVGALFIYGLHFFYLTYLAYRNDSPDQNGEDICEEFEWPMVTVQLPIFNELYVAERVIDAAAGLDYPVDRLQIQVLDDSTDETRAIVRSAVEGHQASGINICHLCRPNREGYKAGALRAGLASATGEYVAMFDADFVPRPDFLQRMLPAFGPDTAFVQARWGHLNRDYSFMTSMQSLAIDAHFAVEQFARRDAGLWFNFNGSAGVWRRAALDDAGGWRADTLTEDLDISYRALLRGWRGEYLREVEVPAELPVSMVAFRRQQHRWARGSLECALKLGPQVWESDAPLRLKLSASLHLTGYAVHLLLFALSLLYPAVLLVGDSYPQLITLFGMAAVFNITAFAPTAFFVVGQQQLGRPWKRSLPQILFLTSLGSGLMLNTVRAALQILTKKRNVFERTAKFGIKEKRQTWQGKKYQLRLDPIVFWEAAFACLNLSTAWIAATRGNWALGSYALIFAAGLLYVSGMTIIQAVGVSKRRQRRKGSRISPVALRLGPDTADGGD